MKVGGLSMVGTSGTDFFGKCDSLGADQHVEITAEKRKMIWLHNLLLSIPKVAEGLFEGCLNNRQLINAMHSQNSRTRRSESV